MCHFFCIFAPVILESRTLFAHFPTTNLHLGTEKNERLYILKEIRHSGVGSPLRYRGSARPVVGMVVCAVLFVRTLKQISLRVCEAKRETINVRANEKNWFIIQHFSVGSHIN